MIPAPALRNARPGRDNHTLTYTNCFRNTVFHGSTDSHLIASVSNSLRLLIYLNMKTYLFRTLPFFGIMGFCLPQSLKAQGATDGHTVPTATFPATDISIPQSFAPFGARPNTDKIGDDGSVATRDRNGVLIWQSSNGASVRIPDSSLALTLYVSNTECVVYSNRFARNYNVWGSVSEVIIYRRLSNNVVTASPTITIRGTLLDTSIVTPTSFGFNLVAAYGWNFSTDESTVNTWTKTTTTSGTPPVDKVTYNVTSAKVDQYHNINYEMYRVTWDAAVQYLSFSTVDVPKTNTNLGGTVVLGSGDDSSLIFNTIVAGNYTEDRGSVDPEVERQSFTLTRQSLWATWQINSENVATVDFNDFLPNNAYVSNSRLLLQSQFVDPTVFPVAITNAILDYRMSPNGILAFASSSNLDLGDSLLPVSTYTRGGLPPYIYVIDQTRTQLKFYTYGSSLMPLGGAVTLPSAVVPGADFVRNPRDGSLLINSDASGVIWVPTTTNPATASVAALGTPKIIPGSVLGLPLFVSSTEAVVWMNKGSSVDLADSGQVPPARISHFGLTNFPNATNLTPPITGRVVAQPSPLTQDPDSEGWYINTFEKVNSFTARSQTYRLFRPSDTDSIDSDGDGLSDALEARYGTNPNLQDTDGDGVNDYQEIFIFFTNPLVPSFGTSQNSQKIPFGKSAVTGVYEGIVSSPEDGQSFLQSLRLSSTGRFTARLRGLSSNTSFSGRFSSKGVFQGNPKGQGLSSVRMSLTKAGGSKYVIEGSYTTSTGGVFYFQLRPALKSYKAGKLTFSAGLSSSPSSSPSGESVNNVSNTGPSGSVVATGAIRSNGNVRFNVYLPSGSRSTYSGPLLKGVFMALYARSNNQASDVLLGTLKFKKTPGVSDFSGSVRLYSSTDSSGSQNPSGYDQNRLLLGARYVQSAKGTLPIPGFPVTANNALFTWFGGDYDGVVKVGTWSTNGRMSAPPSPTDSATARFNPSTGLVQMRQVITDADRNLTDAVARGYAVVQQRNRTFNGFYNSNLSSGNFLIAANRTGLAPDITTVSPQSKDVSAARISYDVYVGTAGQWEVNIPASAFWITATVSTASGGTGSSTTTTGIGNGYVTITVALNTEYRRREASIRIAGVTHTIKQDFR